MPRQRQSAFDDSYETPLRQIVSLADWNIKTGPAAVQRGRSSHIPASANLETTFVSVAQILCNAYLLEVRVADRAGRVAATTARIIAPATVTVTMATEAPARSATPRCSAKAFQA